ncbi:MAG: winged helix-turn-helix transcriptional regulator [Clostridiales bacterium]|nr:winged helix-turn-helix transcriptional regulator [Clostridiales bacterium]
MNCYQSSIPILKVLCDETRLIILNMLSEKDMNGCEIHRAFLCTQPTISYHMKLLVEANLVHAHKEGCATVYSINQEIWPSIKDLLQVLCTETSKKELSHE